MAAVVFLAIQFIVVLCVYFFFNRKRSSYIEYFTDPVTGRKKFRILEGHFERGKHDKLYIFGESQLSNIVVIESTVHLKKTDLVTALVALGRKHPYLRMRCEWEHGYKRYLTEMDRFTENELLYSEEKMNDWVSRFEQDLQQGYDLAHGPLWRVVKIQETFDSTTKKYTTTFLFSFHHAICDELSVLSLLDQVLELLDQFYLSNYEGKYQQSLPVLPPLLDLVQHHTRLSWWEYIVMRVKTKLQSLKGLQNNLLDMLPPPLAEDQNMVPTTCVIPGTLTEQQTTQLVKNCKANKSTVTGALGICFATAIFKMAAQFGKKISKLDIGFPTNVRQGCEPVVKDDDIGLFIGIVFLSITKSEDSFWDQTRKTTTGLKQQLSDNKQYGIDTLFENGLFSTTQYYKDMKKNRKYAGRYPNIELTNCGNFSFNRNRFFTVKQVNFAVSLDVIGPIITVSSVTVNGQLHWSVVYSNIALHKDHARRFSQLFHESLIELGCKNNDL